MEKGGTKQNIQNTIPNIPPGPAGTAQNTIPYNTSVPPGQPGAEEDPEQKYICPPGFCMEDPAKLRKYLDEKFGKAKYIIAGVLLGCLILTLVIYAVLCTQKSRQNDEDLHERAWVHPQVFRPVLR